MEEDCRHARHPHSEYFGIDLELTWEVVTKDIPNLKQEMLKIKRDLS